MSDLDQLDPRLDSAFESLTRDLAHSHGPGAAAAMATARTRRRAKVGAVALATALVVGGGLTVPRLLFPADGVAANGGSARFDTTALERATVGWIDGWETWTPDSPYDHAFGSPYCLGGGPADTLPVDEPERTGHSTFITPDGATARLTIASYPDTEGATASQALSGAPGGCGTTTTYVVDGVEVRHQSMPRERSETPAWLGDVWSVRIGTERARLDLAATTDLVADGPAEEVAELLVAGLRDGWTQTGMKSQPPVEARGELPAWSDVDLK